MTQLYGKGDEPFWLQAQTNLVKFLIALYQMADDYVTLFDVYQAAIEPDRIATKIAEGERRWDGNLRITSRGDYIHAISARTPGRVQATGRFHALESRS